MKSHFSRKNVIILSLCTQRCYGRHNVSRNGLQILLHGVISLPDATSYDKVINYLIKTVVLNHDTACEDISEDIVTCVAGILQELGGAFESGDLPVYCRPVNLLLEPLIPRIYKDLNTLVFIFYRRS